MFINSISVRFLEILVFVLCLSSAVRSLSKSDCRCKLGTRRRIVGGKMSDFVPWQVALFDSGRLRCSGIILNEYHVATAAHCTSRNQSSLQVAVGVISLIEIDAELIYDVEKVWNNPQFNESFLTEGHDLAILKLDKKIKFKIGQIEPACVKYQVELVKDPLMVTGFGGVSPIYVKNGLRSLNIPSNDLKYAHFKEYKNFYPKQVIYVLGVNASDNTCLRDSGSPISMNENGRTLVIGLHSFGMPVMERGTQILCYGYSGFCRLSYDRSFIEKYVNKDYCLF